MNKHAIYAVITAMLLIVGLFGNNAIAEDEVPVATPGAGITIYMDTSAIGRTRRAARNMTSLHAQYFEKGWIVIDVEPYVEDGDLEGFFITYRGKETDE